RPRGEWRALGREAGPGAAGLADAGAVRPDRARHHRIPGICRRAGGPQAPVHGRVGDPVPGVLHLPRLAPQEGILARRALRRDREARSPEKRPMMATSPRMRNALTLFSSVDAVLCHRVRLVLAAKGVTYDFIPVDPQNPPEDLIDLNPYRSVPTLVARDLVLYAASVVSEYLDERDPHPPLMPVDPLSRARLRLAMLRIEHDWVPQVQAIQLGNKQQAEAGRKRLKELLTAAVPLFKASKFFLNPEMSLADCAMAPIIWRLDALGVGLPRDGKCIEDYGNRIFRNPGFA